jgi:hypothetical protein
VLNNLEGTLVFVRNIEAARHILSKACKMTRNEKEAWIVESLLAGDCIIQVFNQKKKRAEEDLEEATGKLESVKVRNEKVRLRNPSPLLSVSFYLFNRTAHGLTSAADVYIAVSQSGHVAADGAAQSD